ncbi:hypothetical protein KAR91_32945 [Candidatus Pacearchaeota archaeon]|nr:hypothetical protein [Candidatus Pacearchaeota archaeon]
MPPVTHKSWDINEHATGRFKDGKSIVGAIFQNGLNDIEPDGSFVPCDERISEVTQGVTHLKMNRGRMGELRFGDSNHPNSFLVKIKNKALKGVSFKYTGAEGESMTANNGKPLCHFDNGISIETTPYYKGVKMDIIVNDPLTAPFEYPFSVKTYGQDYNFIEENGGATLKGEDQEPIFIKPPYAVDANGDIGPVTIHYTGIVNNLITFKKVVDEAWFRQAAAPVRIDPDVTIDDDSGTLIDTILYGPIPDSNYGTNNVGICEYTANRVNELIKVDLSSITGAAISGYFGLDIHLGTFPLTIEWHKTLKPWIEGTHNGGVSAGEPTWNSQSHPDAWDTGGCLGDGTDRQTVEEGTKVITATGSDQLLNMTIATMQSWLNNPVNNHGVVISAPNSVAGKTMQWRSSEAVAGNKPYFYIEYTEAAAAGRRRRTLIGRN